MKKHSISFLLLVIISFKLTHANVIPNTLEQNKDSMEGISLKTTINTFKVNKPGIVKQNNQEASSVVQNWNLVCRELCGAGLGGQKCGPQCPKTLLTSDLRTINQTSQARDLLGQNHHTFCSILCPFGLGDPLCICPHVMIDEKNKDNDEIQSYSTLGYNIICSLFCDYKNVTLTGCSPCSKTNPANDDDNKRSDDYIVNKFSTTTTTTVTTSTTQPTTFTTPNWTMLCKHLCRTGDGGQLCNCDLPPLFI